MPQGHGHHHRQRQSDAGLHFGLTPDKVMLEAKAVVDAVVDPLQGTAPVVPALPGGTAMGGGHEDAPVLLGEFDTDNAPELAGADVTGLVALDLALAVQTVRSGGAAVFEGIAVGLETLEGQVALFAGGRADAVDGALFSMDDGVDALGVQGAGDGSDRTLGLAALRATAHGYRSGGGCGSRPTAAPWSRRCPVPGRR